MRDGGFVGLIVNTSVKGEYLDSERADAFFDMASELGVPIFLHPPAEPVGSDSIEDFRLVEQVGRFMDVTVGLATLRLRRAARAAPRPAVHRCHRRRSDGAARGAARPGLPAPPLGRWRPARRTAAAGRPAEAARPAAAAARRWPATRTRSAQPPSSFLRNVYVDTANSSIPNHLANLEVMGPDHLLFGTDSPPLATPLEDAIGLVEQLPVSPRRGQGILEGNARRLFALEVGASG